MRIGSTVRVLIAISSLFLAWPGTPAAQAQVEGDPIDLVIVLDVSGTMKGLIESTRLNIWEIVNELAEAEPTPHLRVGLVTYGNQRGSRLDGWVRVENDLTDDLDRVSERLFRFKRGGANEMVGRALKTALEGLDWAEGEHALRLLFIAGNEPADQDPDVRFRWMSEAAGDSDIHLSAVYCGGDNEAAAATWKEMAELAEGSFVAIDHRTSAAILETPFDRELAELGDLLNETVVPLGPAGAEQKKIRVKQDKHARSLGLAVAATRAQTKSSALYSSGRDLVSLFESGELHRHPVDERDLPRAVRRMTDEERDAYLQEISEVRREVRDRVDTLSAARRAFVSERLAEGDGAGTPTFDKVVRRTIREKAEEFGYSFPERGEE